MMCFDRYPHRRRPTTVSVYIFTIHSLIAPIKITQKCDENALRATTTTTTLFTVPVDSKKKKKKEGQKKKVLESSLSKMRLCNRAPWNYVYMDHFLRRTQKHFCARILENRWH